MGNITSDIVAVNVGLRTFADGLRAQGVQTVEVDWRPPADAKLVSGLRRLQDSSAGELIEEANSRALDAMLAAKPIWVGIKPALDVVPGMKPNMILHAGPPIEWERMLPAQRRGIIGGVLHEGLASNQEGALAMIKNGEIEIGSAPEHYCVGAGAGIITPRMVVNVSTDLKTGSTGYCIPFEGRVGLGVWGVYNETVERNLREIEDEFAPAMTEAIGEFGGINVKSIIARGLQMSDEMHTRQTAAGLLLVSEVVPMLLRSKLDRKMVERCIAQLTSSERWFHPIALSASMCVARGAMDTPHCTIVNTIAQNGVETGIKVGFSGDQWFKAAAPRFVGSYFSSQWGPDDAVPFMGDSTVAEVVGMGAFAAAAAPVVLRLRNGGYREAIAQSEEMRSICAGVNHHYPIPLLDFTGPGIGIDIRKVVQLGVTPLCHGGIISKDGGQIGAGAARFPIGPYVDALRQFILEHENRRPTTGE